jgi:hypothetical protein
MPKRLALPWLRRTLGVAALLAAGALVDVGCRSSPAPSDDGKATSTAAGGAASPAGCGGPATATGKRRFLALLVGVGDYAAADKLLGPKNDVEAMRRLLVEQYGFPAGNVCALVDGQATTAAFRKAFDAALVDRAQAGDVAVFYFSGHGSQAPDENGDEPDGWDETLLLQDARSGGVHDLVDDELNGMLARLYAKTENVSVLLDSCNSGTATRAATAGTARARLQPPAGSTTLRQAGPTGGLRDEWLPAEMAHAVVFTAASDGTSALETDGRGVFTTAFVQVLSEAGKDPLTWAAAARRIPDLVKASSPQIPYFQGDLEREVFGAEARPRPPSWEVKSVGPPVAITGPPVPGMGVGAELRVYASGLKPADYADPAKSKGTLVVQPPFTGLNASATLAARPGAPAVRAGDLAVLVRPADDALRISVRLRPKLAEGDGGLDAATVSRIRAAIAGDPDAKTSVVVVGDGPGSFELSRMGDRLVLRGPEDHVRNQYASEGEIPRSLWLHARQRALLALQPEGGEDFVVNDSLQVQIVPAASQKLDCGKRALADWVQSPPNVEQVVPLCTTWQIKVKLQRKTAMKPVLVGGVVLSSNGATFGFPQDGHAILLQPGEETTLPERYVGGPPLDAEDTVRVFGTQETNPVNWALLTTDSKTRGAQRSAHRGALHRALDRYLTVGSRGVEAAGAPAEDTTWTATSVSTRVEANARFARPEGAATPVAAREYTIRNFDLRPYRSDDPRSALDRVLAQADALARTQVGYKQHPWAAASDVDNLKLGIDCSRAVWFAFTRAGLPYTRRSPDGARPPGFAKDYLTTAEMVAPATAMADLFEPCSPGDPRIGDLLVYRDDERGDGHVVMVIDPPKRIAWGSHGWDGSGAELKIEPQTGVEFQRIKYKPDWDRWDRRNMRAKACWRYKAFARELAAGGGPGLKALDKPCTDENCPSRAPPAVLGSR